MPEGMRFAPAQECECLRAPLPIGGRVVPLPFEKDGYTLHKRDVILKGGRHQTIYFFARAKPKSGTPMQDLPVGYAVGVNKRTGLPYLKKK
jgi:hypothetical protein